MKKMYPKMQPVVFTPFCFIREYEHLGTWKENGAAQGARQGAVGGVGGNPEYFQSLYLIIHISTQSRSSVWKDLGCHTNSAGRHRLPEASASRLGNACERATEEGMQPTGSSLPEAQLQLLQGHIIFVLIMGHTLNCETVMLSPFFSCLPFPAS